VPDLIVAPFFLAAFLVDLGGAAKIRRPRAASEALASVHLPSRWWEVRLLGLVEISLGAWALLAPGTISALALAALYLGFAGFLTALIVGRVPAASCGCVGQNTGSPSFLHVGLDLVAAGAAITAVTTNIPSLGAVLADQPLFGIPFLVAMGTATYAAVLSVGALSALRAEVKRSSALGHRHDRPHHRDHQGLLQVSRGQP
jgi:hypothetical protein